MVRIYLVAVFVQVIFYVIANQIPNKYACCNEPYKLSVLQFKVYSGEATLKDRLSWLIVSGFICLVFPPTHITALLVAFVVNWIMK